MKLPKGSKRIGWLTICGNKVPVIRVPTIVNSDGDETLLGLSNFEQNCIFIRAGQTESQERDTVVHEGIHMLLHLSGAINHLAGHVKQKDLAACEETLVRILTPNVVAMLGKAPVLK
jgi:Zn-dependent peptidase ImmA (M78 family)